MWHVVTSHCLQKIVFSESDTSFVSENVDESESLESVIVKKSCRNGKHGRLSSDKKRTQLKAASAREKYKLDLAVRDAVMPVSVTPPPRADGGANYIAIVGASGAGIATGAAALPSSAHG